MVNAKVTIASMKVKINEEKILKLHVYIKIKERYKLKLSFGYNSKYLDFAIHDISTYTSFFDPRVLYKWTPQAMIRLQMGFIDLYLLNKK